MDSATEIGHLYSQISSANLFNKANLYFAIIQLKEEQKNLTSLTQPQYLDVKCFIDSYILSRKNEDYGYDFLDIGKILKAINLINTFKEKHELLIWSKRILLQNHFLEEAKVLEESINKNKLNICWEEKGILRRILKCILHLTSYNLWAIVISLIVIFSISYIIFLPAYFENLILFNIEYHNYSDYFALNHLLNLLAYTCEISSDIKINPVNWLGLVFLLFLKLFYTVIIANYLFKIILNQINKN